MKKNKFFYSKNSIIAFAIMGFFTFVAAQQPEPTSNGKQSDTETDIIKAILLKEVVRIVEGNISAADRENGELNKLIRALSGVSMKDIDQYGICGGPNSEVRKLLGSTCGKIN